MERELVLFVSILATCGPLAFAVGPWPAARRVLRSGRDAERAAWRRLWLPLLPAAAALVLLLGWALQEPDPSDELLRPLAVIAALPWALVCGRALARALRSLRPGELPVAATVGVLRPTVHLAPALARAIDAPSLAAAREHEAAHARHRDPLRVWLAQVAADLQWPWPAAAARLRDWRHALELARDEEARLRGADGADLAEAILAAARIDAARSRGAVALGGDADRLRDRIGRLLRPVPAETGAPSRSGRMLLVAVLAAAAATGVANGDALVRSLPGIGP